MKFLVNDLDGNWNLIYTIENVDLPILIDHIYHIRINKHGSYIRTFTIW